MSRAGQMQILALNKMVNIKIFEEKLNKPTGKHPRFSQFNAPRIEPGYKWCFSSLSSSSHPFLGEDIIFILGQFSILILLHPYKQLHQCNPRDVSEERERSCCHVRGGQSPVHAGVRLYSSAEGACSDPSSSLCLFSGQPDPASHSICSIVVMCCWAKMASF